MITREEFLSKPRFIKEITNFYNIGFRAMKNIIIDAGVTKRKGAYYYLPNELKKIDNYINDS